jgi:hypothetical protein
MFGLQDRLLASWHLERDGAGGSGQAGRPGEDGEQAGDRPQGDRAEGPAG